MENRTNQVIELENNKEYLILRQVVYKNETYYVTTEIFNDGEDFEEKLTILKETKEGKDTYINVVNNPDIIKVILKHIE